MVLLKNIIFTIFVAGHRHGRNSIFDLGAATSYGYRPSGESAAT